MEIHSNLMQKSLFFIVFSILLNISLSAQSDGAPDQRALPNPPTADQVIVISRPSPVKISGVTEICKGSETILKVEGDYESFSWDNGANTRFIIVREEGKYEVTVKTKGGCTYTSSVIVRTRPCT